MYPPCIQKGDTIGIVTLGSPSKDEEIKRGTAVLTEMGYKVHLGEHILSQEFPAAPPKVRATDLMQMFLNPKVKMILGSRGGTGVADILVHLDYKQIKQNPKILAGYSDFSILLNAVNQQTGLITYNTPMLLDLHPETPEFTINQLIQAISTRNKPYTLTNPSQMPLVCKVKGKAVGPLVGGNLTSIIGSLGTPFEINTNGKILFLEEINEYSTQIYRLLTHLIHAGKFRDVSGIILGEFTKCPTEYDTPYEQIVEKLLVPLGKPLLMNLATGHGKYKATLPIGALVRLDTESGAITIL